MNRIIVIGTAIGVAVAFGVGFVLALLLNPSTDSEYFGLSVVILVAGPFASAWYVNAKATVIAKTEGTN